jgi:hypothetical protein
MVVIVASIEVRACDSLRVVIVRRVRVTSVGGRHGLASAGVTTGMDDCRQPGRMVIAIANKH